MEQPQPPTPTIGRIVHYRLSSSDVEEITRRRTTSNSIAERIKEEKWPLGAQAHIGNSVAVGQIVPAVVVAEFGGYLCNLQCILDGCDSYWALTRDIGPNNGNWCWPERV